MVSSITLPSVDTLAPRLAEPHQLRSRNDLIETQRTRSISDENARECTKPIFILPLIAVWLQVRVLSEPTTKSIAVQSIAPNAEKFDNQEPRAASLLFVRRDTQSYDEVIAAVPLSASPEHDVRND